MIPPTPDPGPASDGGANEADMDWSPEERRWIKRMKGCLMDQPEGVLLYTTDGEITACKSGVSSYVIAESLPGMIRPGAVLTDLHEGEGRGGNRS